MQRLVSPSRRAYLIDDDHRLRMPNGPPHPNTAGYTAGAASSAWTTTSDVATRPRGATLGRAADEDWPALEGAGCGAVDEAVGVGAGLGAARVAAKEADAVAKAGAGTDESAAGISAAAAADGAAAADDDDREAALVEAGTGAVTVAAGTCTGASAAGVATADALALLRADTAGRLGGSGPGTVDGSIAMTRTRSALSSAVAMSRSVFKTKRCSNATPARRSRRSSA
jgi:hypothetical protein